LLFLECWDTAKPSITLDIYGHLLPSMQIEAAEKIDLLITPVALNQDIAPVAPELHQTLHELADERHPYI
jgi:hypothetical protein